MTQEKEKVGTPTGRVTQHGRPEYKTPDGELVSEKSATLPIAGKFVNVPSIHNGYMYDEDELMDMLKMGTIKPTSMHDNQEDAIKAAEKRSKEIVLTDGKAEGGIMMAQEGKVPLTMQEATSAPQGGGPKAANPAAVIQGLAAPSGPAPRPGDVDPRDEAVKEVSAKMQAKQTPPPAPPAPMAPSQGGIAGALMQPPPAPAPALNPMMQPAAAAMAPPSMPQVPAMAKGGMPEDTEGKGLAVMIGLGAPTPSYEEAAEGNPPPGATKEEVADDQLVLLSEGELVVPANVVRYHGLGTYEGMRRDALMGIQEMENSGQIEYVSGGKEKADPIDDNGGLIKAQAGTTLMGGNPGLIGPGIASPLFGPITTPEAASQQFVTTPTTSGTPRSGATTDTTPLTISDKPYTPTTDLTEVYAPNVNKYKESTDAGDDGDDGTAPPVDPCPPGYKMNATTGVCEPIAQRRTGPPSPDDDGDSTNDPTTTQTTFFGGYSDGKGSIRGATRYNLTGRTAEPGAMGLVGGLFSALTGDPKQSQKIVIDQNDPTRRAIMSQGQYDFMRDNIGKGGQTGYIETLMDKQARINADYEKIDPPTGFLGEIGRARRQHQYEHDTAKAIMEGLEQEYTGQSLAEAQIIQEAATQNMGIADYDDSGIPSNIFSDDGAAGTNMGTSADIDYSNTTPEAVARVANDFKSNVGNMSMDQQLKALNLMTEGRSGTVIGEDGEVVNVNPDNIYGDPGVNRTAISALRADIQRSVTPDVFAKMEEGIDAEAAGFESGLPDEQPTLVEINARAQETARRRAEEDRQDAAAGRGNIVRDSSGRPVTSGGRPVTTEQGAALRNTPGGDDEINRQAEAMRREAQRNEDAAALKRAQKSEEENRQDMIKQSGSAKASSPGDKSRAGEDGPGGDPEPSKIVCTEMYRQTQLEDWARTMKIWDTYQKKYLTPIHEVGYHWLFKPYVRGMQNSGILTNVGAFFAQKRTQHLRHVLTKGRAKDSFVGNVWCKIIHPIVYLVGKMVYKK